MAKDKHPAKEQPPLQKETNGEIQHRLTTLENSVAEIRKSHLENHKWFTTIFTTIIFGLVGLLLAYTGNQSKNDVREAIRDMKSDIHDSTRDMQGKIDSATSEINRKFAALSGEALKRPLLEISDKQGLLDGQTFEISSGGPMPIYPLFFKNIGDKRTDPLSIRLYASADVQGIANGGDWQTIAMNDKDYPFCYYSYLGATSRTAGIGIAPQETWTMQQDFGGQLYSYSTNVIVCKLQIFYGADKAAEAKFVVKFK
ncbi:MAG: hypothetical protein WDN00_14450 [Limisphaerales bacterium]